MACFLCRKLNPVPPVSARNHTPEGTGTLDFLGSVYWAGRDMPKRVTNSALFFLWGLAWAVATTSHLCSASLPHSGVAERGDEGGLA